LQTKAIARLQKAFQTRGLERHQREAGTVPDRARDQISEVVGGRMWVVIPVVVVVLLFVTLSMLVIVLGGLVVRRRGRRSVAAGVRLRRQVRGHPHQAHGEEDRQQGDQRTRGAGTIV